MAIQKSGLPASGGGHCGPVFSEIARNVMAQGVFRDVAEGSDSASVFVPDVMAGNLDAAAAVLRELSIPVRQDWNSDESGRIVWGRALNNGNTVSLHPTRHRWRLCPM